MKISLCTIVRNDQLVVRRMLESVVDFVDEVVIADTGSTDATVQVIRSFMEEHPELVRLIHFDWIGDFSKARNFTLENSEGDWILVLDADEFLDQTEARALRGFLEGTQADGIFITQRNYTGSMQNLDSVMDVDVVRLFRRGYTYEGRIHEQIAGSIYRAGGRLDKFKLHLHHIGYTQEYLQLKGKNKRNVALLKNELSDIPYADKQARWFQMSNLLAEYSGEGRWTTVASEARLLIEEIKKEKRTRFPPFTPRIYKFCINGLRCSGRMPDAVRMCREAIAYFPRNTDLRMMLAEILMAQNEYREALSILHECREIGDVRFDFVEYVEGNGTYIAAKQIAYCWLRLGDDVSALEWYVQAFQENAEQLGVIPWIVLLTHDVRVLHELAKVIRTPQRYDEFIEYYAAAGHDDAISYIDDLEAKWGPRPSIARARFAYEVRHRKVPTLRDQMNADDLVRIGLWHYEHGSRELAQTCWSQAGAAGDYFLRVSAQEGVNSRWEMKNVLPDLLAARAVRFLTDFAVSIADLPAVLPVLLHTDLMGAFSSEAFCARPNESVEEAEWKAQLYLTRGKVERVEGLFDDLRLSDGELSVRGYLIGADASPPGEKMAFIQQARRAYPKSRTLQTVWQTHFAAPVLQNRGLLI